MFNIGDMGFMIESMGSFWSEMPMEDQYSLLNIWRGYCQLSADMYAQAYQHDYNKSLQDIQPAFFRLWRKYDLWNYYAADYEPTWDSQDGIADDRYVWDSDQFFDCTFDLKGGWDRDRLNLVSKIDQWANVYWQAKIRALDGPGALIGYFNSYSTDLTNTLAFGWADGRAIGVVCTEDNTLHLEYSPPILDSTKDYTLTGTYMASGGELAISVLDDTNVNIYNFSVRCPVVEFPVEGVYTLSTGASGVSGSGEFECDCFGLANINNKGHIDDFARITTEVSGTGYIYQFGYEDPSVDTTTQRIDTLQSELDAPILTLSHGVTGGYLLINSELHFYDILPASYLWSPKTYYDNPAIQDSFGTLVKYQKLDDVHTNEEYLNGVKGLWHSYLFGPTINNLEAGLAILAREPFATKSGTIIGIYQYDDSLDYLVLDPDDGSEDQYYYYRSDIGLAVNPDTEETFKVGDTVDQYQVLTDALQVVDIYNAPTWYRYHLIYADGLDYTIQRFKSFGIRLKPLRLVANSLSLMICNFINHLKPSDTRAWFTKEDDQPLFIIGQYDHYPYVDVQIIGNQEVYLPADFVFDDSQSSTFKYGQGLLTGSDWHDTDPPAPDIPILNISGPTVYDPGFTPSSRTIRSSLAYGTLLFMYDTAAFYSLDEGTSWGRMLNSEGSGPAVLNIGDNLFVKINVLQIAGQTLEFGYGVGVKSNQIQSVVFLGPKIYEEPSSVDVALDVYTGPGVVPITVEKGTFNVVIDGSEFIATGQAALFAGVKNSDQTKLIVYSTELDVTSEESFKQTQDLEGYILGDTIDHANVYQKFVLKYDAPNGITASILMSKNQYPTDDLYIILRAATGGFISQKLINGALLPEYANSVEFTFNTPLNPGTYYLQVYRDPAGVVVDPTNNYTIRVGATTTTNNCGYSISSLDSGKAWWIDLQAPLEFPNDYITISHVSDISLPVNVNLVSYLQNSLDIFYAGEDSWVLLCPVKNSSLVYILTSDNNGLTWDTTSFLVKGAPTSITMSRLFRDTSGNIYFYYKQTDGQDYMMASKDTGVSWSNPIALSSLEAQLKSSIYPSYAEGAGGITYFIGVSTTNTIMTFRLSVS